MNHECQPICSESERRFLSVFNPPDGEHEKLSALRAAVQCLKTFCTLIESPTPLLFELIEEYHSLDNGVSLTSKVGFLGRFSNRYPAWGLLLSLHAKSPKNLFAGAGAAIADALVCEKPIPPGLARMLLRISNGTASPSDLRRNESHIATARLRHSSFPLEDEKTHDLRTALRIAYRNFDEHAGEHRRQCRNSRRTLSDAAYIQTATVIRARVESGDLGSVWLATAALTGLTLELTGDIPLFRPDANIDAVLDIEEGVFLLDLDILAPHARQTPAVSTTVVPATRIVVRPLPQFLQRALIDLKKTCADAKCVRDLFAGINGVDTADLGLTPHPGGFRPSLARFQNTTESFAVRHKISQVHAGHLSGRYQSATRSKLYYLTVAREDIWQAASTQFTAMGWGNPTPLRTGPAIGAQALATSAAVTRWFNWMLDEVEAVAPGRRTSFERLVEHHNRYALLTGSLLSFFLALREVGVIPLYADTPLDLGWVSFNDKHVQNVWTRGYNSTSGFVVPLCKTAREQLSCWQRHCVALVRRLENLDSQRAPNLRAYLGAIGRAEPIQTLIRVSERLQPQQLGSQHLSLWWPNWFRMPANWSRAYWQSALTKHGLPSSSIDLLMRHTQAGTEPLVSARGRAVAESIAQINLAMDEHLRNLEIHAASGIVA